MSDFNGLYQQHQHRMEDFWSRRANVPQYRKPIHIFGHPILFDSNHEGVLAAAVIAEEMYSSWSSRGESIWRVHLTVHDSPPPPPPPRTTRRPRPLRRRAGLDLHQPGRMGKQFCGYETRGSICDRSFVACSKA